MSTREPDYLLNIDSLEDRADHRGARLPKRHWIGVRFDCCNVYHRIYKSKDGKFYRGRCPRCLRKVRLRVGPEGTDARFFVAE